jgi:hypothetical protein
MLSVTNEETFWLKFAKEFDEIHGRLRGQIYLCILLQLSNQYIHFDKS